MYYKVVFGRFRFFVDWGYGGIWLVVVYGRCVWGRDLNIVIGFVNEGFNSIFVFFIRLEYDYEYSSILMRIDFFKYYFKY